jgi:hypothetical protein
MVNVYFIPLPFMAGCSVFPSYNMFLKGTENGHHHFVQVLYVESVVALYWWFSVHSTYAFVVT